MARSAACLTIMLSIAGCGGSGEDTNSVLSLDTGELVETTVTGSVGDGPIINGRVVITNASGQVLATQRSDAQANYRIQLNSGRNEFPLLVSVADGTDVVTGDAPSFELLSAILQPEGEQVVNLNPFGTLTVKIAQRMEGGLSSANVGLAASAVRRHLGFGIDARTMGNPMFIVMDEQNAASVVRSSEALGEAVRRSFATSLSTGQFGSEDEVIDAISADLTDGVLDGLGSEGADPRLSATMSIVSAQVMLEVLVNRLEVGGAVATQSLDSAIQQVTDGNLSVPLTNTLAVTDSMLSQARVV
ncbi:MAG: hypothetical protein KJO13_08465, partial [Gammaproteobacteria bacterium]|nr:hypothetical protein [Gammaproteobacteria bacterium]